MVKVGSEKAKAAGPPAPRGSQAFKQRGLQQSPKAHMNASRKINYTITMKSNYVQISPTAKKGPAFEKLGNDSRQDNYNVTFNEEQGTKQHQNQKQQP